MKKNNSHLVDDEIDLGDIIKLLWREKILILFISIICGLAGYLYASFQAQEYKVEITLKNPPPQLFEVYTLTFNNSNNSNSNNNNDINKNITDITEQFIYVFKLNFLSLDSLQSFVEESSELDNFKRYLKSTNISAKKYLENKIYEVKEKNLVIQNKYSFFFGKELDGDIFLNNYVQFVKKKTIFEIKKNLKLSIENEIAKYENSLEKAKLINLENPILRSMNQTNQVVNEPNDLFYKGSKILLQEITYLKRLLIKLENDQFNYEIISNKSLKSQVTETLNLKYSAIGLIFGLLLSLGIIFFKAILKNN
jgi:LPS O-antigen subunit length determinant protein (WzzB/FepE family)